MTRRNFQRNTQKTDTVRYVIEKAMSDLGKLAWSALPADVLGLRDESSVKPMTVSEKVIAYFEQHRTSVFRYLLRRTQDSGRADDLTQETFLRLYRHLQEGRELENAKAWLFTVANNLAIDATRNDSHFTDLDEQSWKKIEESRPGSQADPEKLLLHHERLDRLHFAVLNLTPLQRECLHLRAEGLRYREIADMMEVSMSTVADAVRRATLNLAREVDSEISA